MQSEVHQCIFRAINWPRKYQHSILEPSYRHSPVKTKHIDGHRDLSLAMVTPKVAKKVPKDFGLAASPP